MVHVRAYLVSILVVGAILVSGRTAVDVHEAARGGSLEAIARYKEEGGVSIAMTLILFSFSSDYTGGINDVDSWGETALYIAANNGQTAAVSKLCELGADVNIKLDYNGQTALHAAAFDGHTETVSKLCELGADVNIKDNYNETALHKVANNDNGHNETVSKLIELGADVKHVLNECSNEDGNECTIGMRAVVEAASRSKKQDTEL